MQAGVIFAVNARRGMFVVAGDDGHYFVFEMLGGFDVDVGQPICGDLTEVGDVTLQYGAGEPIDAYGQSGSVSSDLALRMIA